MGSQGYCWDTSTSLMLSSRGVGSRGMGSEAKASAGILAAGTRSNCDDSAFGPQLDTFGLQPELHPIAMTHMPKFKPVSTVILVARLAVVHHAILLLPCHLPFTA